MKKGLYFCLQLFSKWGPLVFWCLFIFYASHRPVPPTMSESQTFYGIDLIYHFFVYGLGGLLFFRAKRSLRGAIVFSVLYGLSDEIHQNFLPFRSFEISDLVMDTIGGGCGAFLLKKIRP